jgi:hypothetical protein
MNRAPRNAVRLDLTASQDLFAAYFRSGEAF